MIFFIKSFVYIFLNAQQSNRLTEREFDVHFTEQNIKIYYKYA